MHDRLKRADEVQIGEYVRDENGATHKVVARTDHAGIVFLHFVTEGNSYPYTAIETVTVAEPCYTCGTSGKAARGWAGNPSRDGSTCPDCRGTGIDATTYGTGSDHCPHCGTDWKRPHYEGCVAE